MDAYMFTSSVEDLREAAIERLGNTKSNDAGTSIRPIFVDEDDTSPLKPQTFAVAYEENKCVAPAVSESGCFIVGTIGVVYDESMATEQVELMKWMISLDEPISDRSWASYWFGVLDSSDERKKMILKLLTTVKD